MFRTESPLQMVNRVANEPDSDSSDDASELHLPNTEVYTNENNDAAAKRIENDDENNEEDSSLAVHIPDVSILSDLPPVTPSPLNFTFTVKATKRKALEKKQPRWVWTDNQITLFL